MPTGFGAQFPPAVQLHLIRTTGLQTIYFVKRGGVFTNDTLANEGNACELSGKGGDEGTYIVRSS
jgi:hypothetical protein